MPVIFSEQMAVRDLEHDDGEFPLPGASLAAPAWEAPPPAPVRTGPQSALESQLLEVWEELLQRTGLGTHDDFWAVGGSKALAERMLVLIDERFGRRLSLETVVRFPTVQQIGQQLLREQEKAAAQHPYVAINAQGKLHPFFFLHGDYVGGGFFCKSLAQAIGPDRPFYAVHPHGLHGDTPPGSIAAMAADRLAALRAVQPEGPYLLGGYCNGALVAYEMARLLEAEGEQVSSLLMLMADGSNYRYRHLRRVSQLVGTLRGDDTDAKKRRFFDWTNRANFLRGFIHYYFGAARLLLQRPFGEASRRIFRKVGRVLSRLVRKPAAVAPATRPQPSDFSVRDAFGAAFLDYIPGSYGGEITLLWPSEEVPVEGCDERYGWRAVCPRVQLTYVPGQHHSCVSQVKNVRLIGETMRTLLDAADPAPKTTAATP